MIQFWGDVDSFQNIVGKIRSESAFPNPSMPFFNLFRKLKIKVTA